jgi:hypothetical protein
MSNVVPSDRLSSRRKAIALTFFSHPQSPEFVQRVADLNFTCDGCPGAADDAKTPCEFAYDLYNTDGDCLALK